MSPRHGRNKPKATLTGEAAAHQARVERARYSYDRIVVTETDDPEAEHWGRFWGDPEGSRTEEEEA